MANDTPRRSLRAIAVRRISDADRYTLTLPVLGTVTLPRPEELAYYGALTALAAIELIDWPIALILATGHALTSDRTSVVAQELGEALDQA